MASAAKTAVFRAAGAAKGRVMTVALRASGGPPGPFPAQVVDLSAVSAIGTERRGLQPLRRLFHDDTWGAVADHVSGRSGGKTAEKLRFLEVFRSESRRPKTGHVAARNHG